ncbi:hypothetical protein DIPPA_30721 [Diplonema papillatum]|nr:hypothetical protein DIPPA_30721 [Diplonema papillatum]
MSHAAPAGPSQQEIALSILEREADLRALCPGDDAAWRARCEADMHLKLARLALRAASPKPPPAAAPLAPAPAARPQPAAPRAPAAGRRPIFSVGGLAKVALLLAVYVYVAEHDVEVTRQFLKKGLDRKCRWDGPNKVTWHRVRQASFAADVKVILEHLSESRGDTFEYEYAFNIVFGSAPPEMEILMLPEDKTKPDQMQLVRKVPHKWDPASKHRYFCFVYADLKKVIVCRLWTCIVYLATLLAMWVMFRRFLGPFAVHFLIFFVVYGAVGSTVEIEDILT